MSSESPLYSALIQLTTNPLYCTSWSVGRAQRAPGPHAKKEGEEQQGRGWASALSFQAVRSFLRWLPLPMPLGFLEGLRGQCRDESCNRNYWMHVDRAVRACPSAQEEPHLLSDQREQNNYQICRWPLASPPGDTPDWKRLLSHSPQNKTWAICNPFFMPCNKNLSWSSRFPYFCALLTFSGLPATRGLDYQRFTAGKYSLSLGVCWGWTVKLNDWLSGCQHFGKALRG